MFLMDVNVLVYAHREDAANHSVYRQWLESAIRSRLLMVMRLLVIRSWS